MKELKVSDALLILEKLCDEAESCNYADFRGTTDERNSCQDRFNKAWDEAIVMVSGIIEENNRKDKLITDLASRLNKALCRIPKEDWNDDFGEGFVLCEGILDVEI